MQATMYQSNGAAPRRSKTALVLAGGGVAGAAYEIGALCAIDEILEHLTVNELDIYVGTSAGALISACLVNDITPRTLLTVLDSPILGIEQLAPQHLFSLNLADAVRRSRNFPGALLSTLQHLVREGRNASLIDFIETLATSLPTGLYDNSSLAEYLRSTFSAPGRSDDFRQLERELAIIATDLDNGERAIFGEPPLDAVPISRAVAASAAIPLFYRPVQIGNRAFIDGGIRGTASLDVAIERGAELIVCINPMVPFDNSTHADGRGISDEGIQQIGYQVFRTFVHAGLHYHLKQIKRRHPEVDIILIEPRRDDPVMFADNTMRYSTRIAIARHSFETVGQHLLDHHDHYAALLSRHNVQISARRIRRSLTELARAGDDLQAIKSAMSPGFTRHSSPGNLTRTLSELERLLDRLETEEYN